MLPNANAMMLSFLQKIYCSNNQESCLFTGLRNLVSLPCRKENQDPVSREINKKIDH